MSSDPERGASNSVTDPGLGEPGTDPGPVERPRTSPILVVIVGTPILAVFGLAVVFVHIPTLMVLVFGGLVGGTVGAVRARRRNQQADRSTRARSSAAGATVGLLAAVGVSVVGFVVFAIAIGVILLMALSSWR